MLRSVTTRALARVPSRSVRSLSSSNILLAPKKKQGAQPAKKLKQGYNKKKDGAGEKKAKAGGMTHLGFDDAVRALKFEKLAVKLDSLEIGKLQHNGLEKLQQSVVKYDDETQFALFRLGMFKKFQHHEMFESPISLVSNNTSKLSNEFIDQLDGPSINNRVCLIGEKGTGKSTLLAQAAALARSKYNNEVILLHLESPLKITEGSSDYFFNKSLTKFHQPMFTKKWLYKLRSANETIFKKLKLTRDILFTIKKQEYTLKKDENTVWDLVYKNKDFGKMASTNAFQFLLEELIHHSKEVPVLASIDDISVITTNPITAYRHTDLKKIHVSELEIGDLILKLISGEVSFNKGGVLLGESKDSGKDTHTLRVGLRLEQYDPWLKAYECDNTIANKFLANGGVKVFDVKNLSSEESTELLEFYEATGALKVRPYPAKVHKTLTAVEQAEAASFDKTLHFEKIAKSYYTITGGNPRELLKSSVLSY